MDSKQTVKAEVKADDSAVKFEKAHAMERFLKNPFDQSVKAELKKFYKLKLLRVKASVESNKFDMVIDMKTLDGNFKKVASKRNIELFEVALPVGETYVIRAIRRNMIFFKDTEEKKIVLKDDMEVEF